jgi:ABC-type uncharacterized transport system substrate-binding protein
MPVVGCVHGASADGGEANVAALRKGLGETGFVEGRNLAIEYRYADNDYSRLPGLVAELARRRVTVILALGGGVVTRAVKIATADVPIVFVQGDDPVTIGLVASLNRPGGNVTGIFFLSSDLGPKRLGLLKELVPAATRGADALVVGGSSLFATRRVQLATLAAIHRLPAVFYTRGTAEVGGLMSYGADISDAVRQGGNYVGRILKGEKPADLPVMQSTKFELILNLQTARSLGLTVPPTLLAIADAVIE